MQGQKKTTLQHCKLHWLVKIIHAALPEGPVYFMKYFAAFSQRKNLTKITVFYLTGCDGRIHKSDWGVG